MSRPTRWLLPILSIALAGVAWLIFAQSEPMPAIPAAPEHWQQLTAEQRLADLHARRTADVTAALQSQGFALGDAVFLRIMKETSELELWLRPRTGTAFKLYKTWPIARWSGTLGPKTKEGDHQAPEGFYRFSTKQLNPRSNYHLAFNIGYPNAFDQALGRTGSLIMVHGKNVSIGCFAMTDPVIEEIYLISEAALRAGQPHIDVHTFPFRMTAERLATADATHHSFWLNLKEGWDRFERTHVPPSWFVKDSRYHFD
jgi:murein L,D-transpeptidase YafK